MATRSRKPKATAKPCRSQKKPSLPVAPARTMSMAQPGYRRDRRGRPGAARMGRMPHAPTTLVILGASGDLTRRLLLPGLGTLLSVEPERTVKVVGADRVELSDEDWSTRVREALAEAELDKAVAGPVVEEARYVRTDALDEGQLRALLDQVEAPLVLYFALPPSVTVQVCALLERIGVPRGTRLALEKPFGNDLDTARELNRQLLRVVPED